MDTIKSFITILSQITTIVVAIVVGFWGFYSSMYVKKEKEVTEFTLKELKLKTSQKPHLQVKLESTVTLTDTGLRLLVVKATLSNLGNKDGKLTLDHDAITLVPVIFSNGRPIFQKPVSLLSGRYAGTLSRVPLQFIEIGSGEAYELTFAHVIQHPGTYLIHFLALNDTIPSLENTLAAGIPYRYSVGADQYLVVK